MGFSVAMNDQDLVHCSLKMLIQEDLVMIFIRNITLPSLVLLLFLAQSVPTLGATIHVPGDQPTIQAGIAAAQTGDTVLVASGTYLENIDFLGKAITVISSDGPHWTVIDGSGSNSVVTFDTGEGPDSVVEGFTLFNGGGNDHKFGIWNGRFGGGVFCLESAPTLKNNIITENHVNMMGGGLYVQSALMPTAMDCTFLDNSANSGGGIFAQYHGTITATGCRFILNSTHYGGGGGLVCYGDSLVKDCLFILNETVQEGGGLWCGGAEVTNCIFSGNYAWKGGAVRCAGGPVFTNCTFHKNQAQSVAGGILADYCTLTITNSIFWDDQGIVGKEITLLEGTVGSKLVIDYSILEGGKNSVFLEKNCWIQWWDRMFDEDPLFVDPANHDCHIPYGSPCIRSGNNAAPNLPAHDFEGDERVFVGSVDIGADEFHHHLNVGGDAVPGGDVWIRITGWPFAGPVGLFYGTGVMDSPLSTQWGDWFLVPPVYGPLLLGSVPANGIITLQGKLPSAPPGPYDISLQALVDNVLTNCEVLYVR
jgi:predicted outer membrane repeat protein